MTPHEVHAARGARSGPASQHAYGPRGPGSAHRAAPAVAARSAVHPREIAFLPRERGMTLVELLVSAAVIALFILMTDRVLVGVATVSRVTQRAADMQQNARVAASRMRREIRESHVSLVTCHPDPSCAAPSAQVAFPSARPSDAATVFCLDVAANDPARRALEFSCSTGLPLAGTYAPVWQRYVGYHVSPDGELRRVVQPGPISLPMAPGSGQVVASDAEGLTISRSSGRFRLRLSSASRDAGGGGSTAPQRMLLEDTVQLRNALDRWMRREFRPSVRWAPFVRPAA